MPLSLSFLAQMGTIVRVISLDNSSVTHVLGIVLRVASLISRLSYASHVMLASKFKMDDVQMTVSITSITPRPKIIVQVVM